MKIDLRLPVYIVTKGYAYVSNYGVFDYATHIYTTYNHNYIHTVTINVH